MVTDKWWEDKDVLDALCVEYSGLVVHNFEDKPITLLNFTRLRGAEMLICLISQGFMPELSNNKIYLEYEGDYVGGYEIW